MKPIFTDRESVAIAFLMAALLLGLVVSEIKNRLAERKLEATLPILIEEKSKFKQISNRLDSLAAAEELLFNESVTLDESGNLLWLDVNKADEESFQLLPGIGPVLAARLVEAREKLGGYEASEDLLQVNGIGNERLKRIKPYIKIKMVNPPQE